METFTNVKTINFKNFSRENGHNNKFLNFSRENGHKTAVVVNLQPGQSKRLSALLDNKVISILHNHFETFKDVAL